MDRARTISGHAGQLVRNSSGGAERLLPRTGSGGSSDLGFPGLTCMTAMKPTLRELTAAHFEPHAGGTFIFQAPADANGNPGAETTMELLEVSLGRKVPAARQPFSLL